MPPWSRLEISRPLPIAVMPFGTVIAMSNVALSRGLSLAGYHPGEPCGSLTTNAPSSVVTQPSLLSSGSMTSVGSPLYSTRTTNVLPLRSGTRGVMTSS